ncbi:hypothetical protein [uncultured Pseudoalteromonas sp.]|uniref:hypothetical protein n=1 Tax=uncultured Pseudoalteromonas sp. TaxID=114053 RepID=UPI0030D71586|tara:strand:+ start:3620 stop:5266 length:1647 start_codon:yes stop_codon:yes gene_type:complete
MRLLIYTLALISAFFVSADEPDLSDLKPPSFKTRYLLQCGFGGSGDIVHPTAYSDVRSGIACQGIWNEKIQASIDSKLSSGFYKSADSITWLTDTTYQYDYVLCRYGDCDTFGEGDSGTQSGKEIYLVQSTENDYMCPPDGFPKYTISVPNANASSEPNFKCAKPSEIKDCPAGYHSKAVSKALGSTECVPKECPAAGTGENLASTPMTGGVPFSGGGMYCNDGCAYSVNAEQISSEKYAVGTSQGVACGDKPYDNKKLADEGDTDGCSTATNGEIDIMSCPNANPTTPETDPHNNDDSKVGEEGTPEKPKDTCSPDDASCNLKNIETEIENSSNKIIDNDNELHNKKIDADTKNTQAVLNIMESVDTAILRQTSQDDKLHAVTVSKFNKLIDAVNGLDVGGGGGGNGTGNGANSGTCVGEGCSDDSKYQGDCEGELCDLDIKPELEQIDSDIIDWFNEKITLPTELTSSFSTMQNFITSNFASFNGTCVPFTLDVSIAGNQKSIAVSQHCEPYETYFKPLVEWLLWTLTAMTLLNMAAQVFRSFSAV